MPSGSIKRKIDDGKLLRSQFEKLTRNLDCCCFVAPEFPIAINLCQYNKLAPIPAMTLIVNDVTLTAPNVHLAGGCRGGYYTNVLPVPAYCGLFVPVGELETPEFFTCCGPEQGDSPTTPVHCPPRGVTCEDLPGLADQVSTAAQCGLNPCGDCGTDLVRGGIPTVYGPGLNYWRLLIDEEELAAFDCADAVGGALEIMRLDYVGGEWIGVEWWYQGGYISDDDQSDSF